MRFLFMARQAANKGLPDLLQAFAQIKRSDWELTVVGGIHAAERTEVDALVKHLGAIRMRPPLAHCKVPGIMREADVVVIPSRYENFCNTALEAMASGRAVIASKCGGIPDLVVDGWNGVLFPPGDVKSLAAAISELLSSPAKAHAFGRNGLQAAKRFDWSIVSRDTIKLFRSLTVAAPDR
jgi:glycogen synthase